jgi:outer membrane protein
MTVRHLALALLATGTLGMGTAYAEDFQPLGKGTILLNVRITQVDPTGSYDLITAAGTDTGLNATVDSNVQPTLGIDYFFTDNLSVEAIAGTTKHEITAVGVGKVGSVWVVPPVITLKYHLNPQARVSPYVGAGINYMFFYNSKDATGFATTKVDDGFGYALQAGADVAVRGRWSANVDIKKVFFQTDAHTTLLGSPNTDLKTKVDLNPWVASVGIGYRF